MAPGATSKAFFKPISVDKTIFKICNITRIKIRPGYENNDNIDKDDNK